jgi:CheY-like chemotaxis protein
VDLDLVRALLINIVSYAVALSEKGAVELTVCEPASGPGGRTGIKILVLDSAPTMSDTARRAVFEPRPAGGLIEPLSTAGMGWHLPVAKLMTDHLGGTLSYAGHRSGGGIFELWVPTEQADEPGAARFTGSRVVALNTMYSDHRQRVPSLRVLVVEDQKSNQVFIETILTKAGHRCELVTSSDEALAVLRRSHYDLVLLDLRLPGRPGLDVLRMVRLGMSTADVDVPVVVLTGESQPEVREACMAAGATDFLAKPISATKLLGAIELVAESRQSARRSDASLEEEPPAMPEHIAELFRDILRYSDELDAYAAHSDWPQVRFTAKAIRGTCQSLELPAISRACRMIADADDNALISGFPGFRQLLDRSIREAEISIRHSLTPQ